MASHHYWPLRHYFHHGGEGDCDCPASESTYIATVTIKDAAGNIRAVRSEEFTVREPIRGEW